MPFSRFMIISQPLYYVCNYNIIMEIHLITNDHPADNKRLPDKDLALLIEHMESALHSIGFVLTLKKNELLHRMKTGSHIKETESSFRHYYKETN